MPTYEPFDWYETPVYYDIIFDSDTDKEATFLEQCHALHATSSTTTKPTASRSDAVGSNNQQLHILEPACGSGRLMAELAKRGHHVAGVDLSKGMLDFAKKRFKEQGVKGKLAQGAMQDFDLHDFPTKRRNNTKRRGSAAQPSGPGGNYDLAHILVSSFKYLQTDEDAAASLTCICDHLRVGGVFVLGIHITEPDENDRTLERWRAQRDGLDVTCTIRSSPPNHAQRTEALRSRIIARDLNNPKVEPKRYESNWTFRTYTAEQLQALLRKEPRFKLAATYTFHHDIEMPTTLDGDDLGLVLVLRRIS